MDLQKLSRERDQLRRVFTRHEVAANTITDFEFLQEKIKKMEILDEAIKENMLSAKDFDQTSYEKECDTCDSYRRKWLELKARWPKTERESENKYLDTKPHLNLPKLEIRKFDDNPKNWLAFWSQFEKIHKDMKLKAQDKLQYLLQGMAEGSQAQALVSSYPASEENYTSVIQTLQRRYGREEILIEIYVRELLNLVLKKDNFKVQVLYDKISLKKTDHDPYKITPRPITN